MGLLLSKSTMPIVQYAAWLLGWLMNGIYWVLDRIGIANMVLCIVFFTIIIYIFLTPVQIKMQKSSKVMALVQPEMQKIQKKYEGKKDPASQQKMQEEMMALYNKYGASPTGSCLPMIIQMIILFALYQVILYIPGYINKVGQMFRPLAEKMTSISGANDLIAEFVNTNKIRVYGGGEYTVNRVIDMLYALKPSQWTKLEAVSAFSGLKSDMAAAAADSAKFNSFAGINISDSPWDVIKTGFSSIAGGTATPIVVVALIVGILIPVLAWFTQWLNMKLMPQQTPANDGSNSMSNQMNTMNTIMPIFSAFICMTFSMGIGVYWIIGGVVRCVQQVVINRRLSSIRAEQMIEAAEEKNQKKLEKDKNYVANITQAARTNVKKIQNEKSKGKDIDSSQFYHDADALDPNSITAKANWVNAYDKKHSKR